MKYRIKADKPESKYNIAKGVNQYYICTSRCVSHGCAERVVNELLAKSIRMFIYERQPDAEKIFKNWTDQMIKEKYEEQYLESEESVEYEWEVIEG